MLPPIPPGAHLNEPQEKLPPVPKGAKLDGPVKTKPRRGLLGSNKSKALTPTGEAVDGDTIRLKDYANARLFGADAFEIKQNAMIDGRSVPIGQTSQNALSAFITPDSTVTPTGTASWGRPVVMLDSNGSDAGRSQIAKGLAIPAPNFLGTNPELLSDYVAAQREAIGAEKGAYAGQFQEPAAYRKQGTDAPFIGKIEMTPTEHKEYSKLLRNPKTTPEKLEAWVKGQGREVGNARELLSFIRRNPHATINPFWQQEDVQGAPVVKDGQHIATRHTQALNEGIIDTLGFPVDLANMGLGAAGVPVSDKPFLGSVQIRDIAHNFGIGQADESTAPRSDVERYTQAFARGTGQAVVPVGGSISAGGRLATRGASLATQASPTRQAARSSFVDAAKAPAATATAELGGGAGANLAGEAAQDYAPGNPYAQIAAQTIGGLAGGVAGFKLAPGQRANVPQGRNNAPIIDNMPPIPEGAVLNQPDAPLNLDAGQIIADGPLLNDTPPLPPGARFNEQTIASDTGLNVPTQRSELLATTSAQPALQDGRLLGAVRGVEPNDILPIPASQIDGIGEAAQIQAGRFEPLKPVDERSLLETNAFRSQSNPDNLVPTKGPIDLVSYIRKQGGLVDQGGDLASMGLTNGRRNLDFAQNDTRMGPLIAQNGNTLDDMALEAWEAGYFPDHVTRPTVEEFIEAVGETYAGDNRRFLSDDFEQVDAFNAQRRLNNDIGKAQEDGAPLVSDNSYPVELSDLDVPPLTAYEDWPAQGVGRVGNINVAKLDSPQDIQRALKTIHDAAGGFDEATRGKVTFEATERLAADLGMDADQLLKRRKGQAFNAEEALASRQILAQSGNELINMARAIQRTQSPGDEMLSQFQHAITRHAAIQEQVSGITAEAGRTLSAMRMTADSREAGLVMNNLVRAGGGEGRIKEAADKILDFAERPGKLNSFVVDAAKKRKMAPIVELWYNSLLSGPQTHIVNALSNTITSLTTLPEQTIAAGIGAARRGARIGRDQDRVLFSEVGGRAVGMLQGIKTGLKDGLQTLKTGDPSDFATKVEDQGQKAIPGLAGEIIRTPSKMLGAADEFFKAIARHSEINAMSIRQAKAEGLRGKAAKDRIGELVSNPTDDMVTKARDYSRYLTFTRPLGPIGSKVQGITEEWPLLKAILPFVRTPSNLLKYSLERSPAAPALGEWRREIAAGGARRDTALARAAFGSSLMALAGSYAAEGKITGAAPSDRAKAALMRANGWQPYSVKVGDKYYSYQRLDPFASIIGSAADFATLGQGQTDKQRDKGAALLVGSVLSNVTSKTWLSGVTDFLSMLDDPERNSGWFLQKLAGSAAVPSIVNQGAKINDPTLRAADSATEQIASRIPGMSDSVPARRDIWGQPIISESGVSPIWESTEKNDPINNHLLYIGARISKPSRIVGGQRLDGQTYGQYQEIIGTIARERIGVMMDNPEYRAMDNEDKADEIKDIMRDARKDARGIIFAPKGSGTSRVPRLSAPALPPGAVVNDMPPLPPGAVLNGQADMPPLPVGARLN